MLGGHSRFQGGFSPSKTSAKIIGWVQNAGEERMQRTVGGLPQLRKWIKGADYFVCKDEEVYLIICASYLRP